MALIKCNECKKKVSDTNEHCIHCGNNIYNQIKNQEYKKHEKINKEKITKLKKENKLCSKCKNEEIEIDDLCKYCYKKKKYRKLRLPILLLLIIPLFLQDYTIGLVMFLLGIVSLIVINILIKNVDYDKENNNYNDFYNNAENYNGVVLISILLPIVGIIIYAINVGKNKNLATSAIAGSIVGFIISSIVVLYLLST